MDSERFEKIRKLFELAKALPPESRDAFLQNACGTDADLWNEVRGILAADDTASPGWFDGGMSARIIPSIQMAFSSGTKLGTYEISGLLGVGGMGEVYRARDSKLKREVAIKVLPSTFAQDPERVARFQHEAELLASVSHAHIGAIYDIVNLGDVRFLVLELVEGEDLADWIGRGPIPLVETLRIARQIADALETAHEKRIVHRDLKPANIKIAADGNVKVLDFGLARLHETEEAIDPTKTPTLASDRGVIAGTVAYMSPEQVKGQPAHRTSDVWAFGCVVYEMLTAQRPFDGETPGETFAEILKTDPDWTRLPAGTPDGIRRLLRRCLQKDRKFRLHDIADARLELEDAEKERTPVGPIGPPTSIGRREWIVAASGAVAAGAAGFLLGNKTRGSGLLLLNNREIRIGAYASLTVGDQSFGHSTELGFRTAAAWQNEVLGREINLIMEDDKDTEKEAERVVRKLIDDDRVIAILGEFKTSLSLSGATIAQRADVPMISHGSTVPALTETGPYIFRVCFTNEFQGWAMAKFAEKKYKKIAVLFDDVGDYSKGLKDAFIANFEKVGSIVETQRYSHGDDTFSVQLKKIRDDLHPDAVFVPGYYSDVGLIAVTARAMGIQVPFLGGDGWDSPSLMEKAGPELENCFYSSHYSVDGPYANADFIAKYRKYNGVIPDTAAALAFDAANVLFKAIEDAKSVDDRDRIRDAIARTTNFPGVTGNITLDANRNATKPAVILRVTGSKPVWEETINPE